jgi:hypothetical protein
MPGAPADEVQALPLELDPGGPDQALQAYFPLQALEHVLGDPGHEGRLLPEKGVKS